MSRLMLSVFQQSAVVLSTLFYLSIPLPPTNPTQTQRVWLQAMGMCTEAASLQMFFIYNLWFCARASDCRELWLGCKLGAVQPAAGGEDTCRGRSVRHKILLQDDRGFTEGELSWLQIMTQWRIFPLHHIFSRCMCIIYLLNWTI